MSDESLSNASQDFDSRIEIDYLLAGLPQRQVSIVTLYQALVRADVDLVIRQPEASTTGREGLVLSDLLYGRLAAVFTEPGLAERWIHKLAPAPHEIIGSLGGEVIALLSSDVGLWLNPEGRRGCRLAPVALHRLREDFGIHLPSRPEGTEPQNGSGAIH